jgi:hypothetical protein
MPIGMTAKNHKSALNIVEREYLRALRPELRRAIQGGEPERAAAFARAIARLERKRKATQEGATDAGK